MVVIGRILLLIILLAMIVAIMVYAAECSFRERNVEDGFSAFEDIMIYLFLFNDFTNIK